MKFYSNIEANEVFWDGAKGIAFVDGAIETEDNELIERLKKEYKFEEDETKKPKK
jgi:hypothetical protein